MPKVNPNVIPFSFQQSKGEILERMNDELPIKLKKWEGFVDRVSKRYPFISKAQVSLIVKSTLLTMRELLVSGQSFSLSGMADDIKLRFYTVLRLGIRHPTVKVRLFSNSIFNAEGKPSEHQ